MGRGILMNRRSIKCVIWDLDNTLWDGVLSEGDAITIRPEALQLVRRLDAGGIVQSIASKNEHANVMRVLEANGLADLFVFEKISWGPKSESVEDIVRDIGIGADSVVFLDDSAFERAEVGTRVPKVACFSLEEFLELDSREHWIPEILSEEAARRPSMYRAEARRKAAQAEFSRTPVEFLATLGMDLTIRRATALDLERASELTDRTNQLNTTGTTFSIEELAALGERPDGYVLVVELTDRFGDSGRIGLCLAHRGKGHWLVELLLLSCRVLGRNLGGAVLGTIGKVAAADGVPLRVAFRPNSRNRQMQITLGLLEFQKVGGEGDVVFYECANPAEIRVPSYVSVKENILKKCVEPNTITLGTQ